MKKIIGITSLLFVFELSAQELVPEQMVSFQEEQILGDARYMGLSGAMGAIGANSSAILMNPASSGRFNFESVSFSGLYTTNSADSKYLGNNEMKKSSNFSLPNLSIFMVDLKEGEKTIDKGIFGIVFQQKSNFFNEQYASGVSSQSGIDYFLNHANNGFGGGAVPLGFVQTKANESIGDLYNYLNTQPNGFASQQAMLAYQGYLIDDASGQYIANMSGGDYQHEHYSVSSGSHMVLAVNGAKTIDDRWTVGANLNLHIIRQDRSTIFSSLSKNPKDKTVVAYQFNNATVSSGTGLSLQLGGTYTYDNFRMGLALETPTWAKIEDEFQQRLITKRLDNQAIKTTDVNPDLVTVYEPYRIKLPGSLTASMGYVFGKRGFLSMDYQVKNPSWMRYRSEGFGELNDFFKNELQATHDLRIGGELRVIKQLSLRAGYRTLSSAYKNTPWIGAMKSYSFGLGYDFGMEKLDFGYMYTEQDKREMPITSGLGESIYTMRNRSQFVLSYTMLF